MKLPMILLWKRHLCPLLNRAGTMTLLFYSHVFYIYFLWNVENMLLHTFKMFSPIFLTFSARFFCKLFKCGVRLQHHLARLWNSKSSFYRCICGQCVTMLKLQSAFAGTICRKSIRNERRKMWTIQDSVVTASRLTF